MPTLIVRGLSSDGENTTNLLTTQGYGGPRACSCGPFNVISVDPTASYVDLSFNLNLGDLELQAAIPSNWIFTNLSGTVAIQATALQIAAPSVLRISITEPRAGDTYQITVPPNGLKSADGDVYDGSGTLTFVGVAIAPFALMAQSIDERKLRVIYSEPVIEADALTVSNYSVSPTLSVFAVKKETDSAYILTTSPQTLGTVYTLTIINVRDNSQNPV